MKLTGINNNASILVTLESGRSILIDPWVKDGIYNGAWVHHPPLNYTWAETRPDYIYISHIHEDHFHVDSMMNFSSDTEIIIGKMNTPVLKNAIERCGFRTIHELEFMEDKDFGDFVCRIYPPSNGDTMGAKTSIPFDLDTSILITDKGNNTRMFHAVDNMYTPEDIAKVRDSICDENGDLLPVQVFMFPAAGAGSYPHVFRDLTYAQKEQLCIEAKNRQLQRLHDCVEIFRPGLTIATGGGFRFAGHMAHYNAFLRQPTLFEMGYCTQMNIARLYEGMEYQVNEDSIQHLDNELNKLVDRALWSVNEHRVRFGINLEHIVYIDYYEGVACIHLTNNGINMENPPITLFEISAKNMWDIVNGKTSWNHLEIGSHIGIRRFNHTEYNPDVHGLMNYLRIER